MLKKLSRSALSVIMAAILLSASLFNSNVFAAITKNVGFHVQVVDYLSVSITTPAVWDSGDADQFLRNKVTLSVTTGNNMGGFTASMYSLSTTDLSNSSKSSVKIPTLSTTSSQRSAFPANYWGYSLGVSSFNNKTYGETDAGNESSYYYPLVSSTSTPITILTGASNVTSGSRDVYFGAKANSEKAAGTYSGIVIFSVVTGTVSEDNPITPVNPPSPSDTTPGTPYYNPNNDSTVYYTVSSTTTTTEVTGGDTRSGYENPAGVIEKVNIGRSSVAAGLAATASVAAAGGLFFIILAKRREDDEEEEEETFGM